MTRSILDARIVLWSPMIEGDPYVARIEASPGKFLPIIFDAASAMKAKRAADDWRQAEVAKREKAEADLARRVEAMQAARAEKKENAA